MVSTNTIELQSKKFGRYIPHHLLGEGGMGKVYLAQDPVLQPLNWHFFFIPFDSVDEFRKTFLQELKK